MKTQEEKMQSVKNAIKKLLMVDVEAQNRKRETADARAIYFDLVRERFGIPLIKIGKSVQRNHATVMHAIKKSNDLKQVDLEYRAKFELIEKAI